jgi:hypothetical protein
MEQYINAAGKPAWKDVTEDSPFSDDLFYEVPDQFENDRLWAFHSNLGSITVLERMTGFGWWDEETGYRDSFGIFWLASGVKDVRCSGATTVGEAIEWIKEHANTCIAR